MLAFIYNAWYLAFNEQQKFLILALFSHQTVSWNSFFFFFCDFDHLGWSNKYLLDHEFDKYTNIGSDIVKYAIDPTDK